MDRVLYRRILAIAILFFLLSIILVGVVAGEVVDRIVAQVNDDIITQSELEQMVKSLQGMGAISPQAKDTKALQRQMLDSLIDRKLALAEAKKRGITVSDRDMEQAMDDFKKRNNLPNDEALTKALSQAGLTLKEVKQQISDQIIQDRMVQLAVGTKATVTEAEVRRVYEGASKEGGDQVHLRIAALRYPPQATAAQKEESRHKADAILKEIRQGGSFKEAVRKQAVSETDMGFIPQGDVAPQLVEHLKKLRAGEVIPVETPEGFQFIQLVARRSGPARSFEEVAPEIRRILMRQDMERRFGEWAKSLREKAYIRIMF